ncbi:MAG: hypothetical protein ACRELY_25910 [Polyangiaceae bacterium]
MNEARAKNGILLAAAVSAAGVFALAAGSKDAGGVIVLAGWALFIGSIHFYGRAGSR